MTIRKDGKRRQLRVRWQSGKTGINSKGGSAMMLMLLILYFAKALPEVFGLDRNAVIPHSDLALGCAELWAGK